MKKPKIVPPTYFLLGIALIFLTYFFLPDLRVIVFPFNLIGFVLIAWGLVVSMQAWGIFNRRKAPINFEDTANFVTDGPYRYTRNPQYLGAILVLVGLAIVLQNPIALVAPFIFFFIMQFVFIRSEEKYLARRFGEQYKKYKEQTRPWI